MKMEPTVSSETSAIRTQTPGNYPKRNKLYLEHGESLKTRILGIYLGWINCFWDKCICHVPGGRWLLSESYGVGKSAVFNWGLRFETEQSAVSWDMKLLCDSFLFSIAHLKTETRESYTENVGSCLSRCISITVHWPVSSFRTPRWYQYVNRLYISIPFGVTLRCKSMLSAAHNTILFWSDVYRTVHHCDSWRIRDQLDVSCYLISLLMCSTRFGH